MMGKSFTITFMLKGEQQYRQQDQKGDSEDCAIERTLLAPPLPTPENTIIDRRLFVGSLASLALLLPSLSACGSGTSVAPKPNHKKNDQALEKAFLNFTEVRAGCDDTDHVSEECTRKILIRWGDPVLPNAQPFNIHKQTLASQMGQFGYNNDHLAFFSFPGHPDKALLCASHEYSNKTMMFPRLPPMASLVDIEMAAHGASIIAIKKGDDNEWKVISMGQGKATEFNRRIYAFSPIAISGPAAGTQRMQTKQDTSGKLCFGTLNNCSGGKTPWNTWLTAEENFNFYFAGTPEDATEQRNAQRYGIKEFGSYYPHWHLADSRFDLKKNPNEPNRFGWVVEVDPFQPKSRPIKRTALGRIKHEGAEVFLNPDKRVVVYSGDDQYFEYLYRYVSNGRFQEEKGQENGSLLDDGVLSVAQFSHDGTGRWLPLVYGQDPLTEENGFHHQADVLIETRRAADLWEATPLDRPEGIIAPQGSDKIFVVLTNNPKRGISQVDAVNSRPENLWGQIITLSYGGGDHTGTRFSWKMFVQGGNPQKAGTHASWGKATSQDGWFACADNIAQAPSGLLTVATDQGGGWMQSSGKSDGVYAMMPQGDWVGSSRLFYRVPAGSEATGICTSSLGDAMFVAVQHPGTDGGESYPSLMKRATFHDPMTRWPDFVDEMPPRPSVVVIKRKNGETIL